MFKKSGITYVFSHKCEIIKIDSYDSLPLEKILTLHNDIILSLSLFLIRIKITTNIIYSQNNFLSNYLKMMIINKFLYTV